VRNPVPKLQSPAVDWERLRLKAKEMRHNPTEAEDRLWQALRRRVIRGLTFRRQHAIGPFIVDFYCVRAGLVIEVDGPIHADQRAVDEERQLHLVALG